MTWKTYPVGLAIVGMVCVLGGAAEARELAREGAFTAAVDDDYKCRKAVKVTVAAPSKEVLFSGGDELASLTRAAGQNLAAECAKLRKINLKGIAGGEALPRPIGFAFHKNDWSFQSKHPRFRPETAREKAARERKEAQQKAATEKRDARRQQAQASQEARLRIAAERSVAKKQKAAEVKEAMLRGNEEARAARKKEERRKLMLHMPSAQSKASEKPPVYSAKPNLPRENACRDYDVDDARQVMECLRKLDGDRSKIVSLGEKGRMSKGFTRIDWLRFSFPIMIKGEKCGEMSHKYRLNMRVLGFWGDELEKRLPSCGVFAELHKISFDQPPFWADCLSPPRPDDEAYVKTCLGPRAKKQTYSCHYLQKRYIERIVGAGHPIPRNPTQKFEHAPNCQLLNAMVRNFASEKLAKYEAEKKEYLDKYYYRITPEREKSKFSAGEKSMMHDGRIAVPGSYAGPTAEEVRLAVMRSVVDRMNEMLVGTSEQEILRKHGRQGTAVVTDGHLIYLPITPLVDGGVQIRFKDVEDMSCGGRPGHGGYICSYMIYAEAETDLIAKRSLDRGGPGLKMAARLLASEMSFTSPTEVRNWFVLTEYGWRQPHTQGQKAEMARIDKGIAQKNQNEELARQRTQKQQAASDRWGSLW